MNLLEILAPYQDFEIILNDKPIRSAQDGATYFQIEIGQTAPTLILEGDNKYFAVIVSGRRNGLDMEEMARVLGCHKVKLAKPNKVKKITGYKVGTIPLVGLSLPYILDKQLFEYDFVYGGTGEVDKTLKIAPAVLKMVNQVIAKFD
ncbi:prolyl-tRNA editing enzyme YbaK/EbsC (Cys-tRNA(Pro) deacylase) [Sporomusaceae bacterium BoRhaA]|uniref:aminoacyl-tRNA deacylase n=1 Tax=Pelorhabdus rhamnosifermentans TaxID=2772457 RepID=UPI001C062F9E|nr:YbaK/EbsC family protein [Pelorhabdus rhamnosifermentans]MBU2703054.1 prolyl-tRNA editing enzyme YbaK/EbsC (Cys-tRNA(Pro) deacylase) [Pelorhabdus rhamnosifermentans]